MALLYYCTLVFDSDAGGGMRRWGGALNLKSDIFILKSFIWLVVSLLILAGCEAERRRSDAELGLNPQQAAGRRLYDNYCDRCHAPYSSRGRQGPSMKGVFKRQFLPMSGMPANDERVTDIIRLGRDKMPGYAQVMTQQQIDDLLAYLHTL